MQLSTLLLASGLGDKVGKQPIKLETLMCHFAKPGGHKLPGIKVQMLMTLHFSMFYPKLNPIWKLH